MPWHITITNFTPLFVFISTYYIQHYARIVSQNGAVQLSMQNPHYRAKFIIAFATAAKVTALPSTFASLMYS